MATRILTRNHWKFAGVAFAFGMRGLRSTFMGWRKRLNPAIYEMLDAAFAEGEARGEYTVAAELEYLDSLHRGLDA